MKAFIEFLVSGENNADRLNIINNMFKEEEFAYPEYWDNRYLSEQMVNPPGQVLDSYEWFRDFKKMRSFLEKHLPPASDDCHILHLGCGNSNLTADLHAIGYPNHTSVDFSQVVINAMKSKYSALKGRWYVMDVRQLDIPDASVNVAIDKSTLDSMIHGSSWNPPDDVLSNVDRYVEEVLRVLKPGGKWLCITYRQPHFMKPRLIRKERWELSVEVLEDPDGAGVFQYFGFVMTKN